MSVLSVLCTPVTRQTRGQRCFIVSEVTARPNWHARLIKKRTMQPSVARANQ